LTPLDEAKKKMLAEHLPYEHNMLDGAFEFLTSKAHAEERKVPFKRNAVVEVFWLHARNLIEFYRNSGVSACASHFTSKRLSPEFRLNKGGERAVANAGREFSDLINEQVCHLKYERVSIRDEKLGGYDLQRVKDSIDRAMMKFQDMLTPEARAVWVDRTPTVLPTHDAAVEPSSHTDTATALSVSNDFGEGR
jgi:hypothetical protein